ncbi:hypothetical protein C6372_10935 [Bacillus halotolerans]|nr:hypothetical protein B9T64_04895 [Bacillus halotolerans]PSA98379.1 hypothetical protein C6372_10935 [Bacillus halotolerans]
MFTRVSSKKLLAFIHHPKILFLDEPTIGLDILRKEEYTEISSSYLLTSHQIDDVERLCKRIILIDEGEIKFDGPKEKLSQLTNSKRSSAVEVDAVHADWGLLSCQPTEVKGKYI